MWWDRCLGFRDKPGRHLWLVGSGWSPGPGEALVAYLCPTLLPKAAGPRTCISTSQCLQPLYTAINSTVHAHLAHHTIKDTPYSTPMMHTAAWMPVHLAHTYSKGHTPYPYYLQVHSHTLAHQLPGPPQSPCLDSGVSSSRPLPSHHGIRTSRSSEQTVEIPPVACLEFRHGAGQGAL